MQESVADPIANVLIQYSAVGLIALIALGAVKVLFNRLTAQLDRETTRGDRLEDELRKLNEAVRNDYIGTIAHASQAISDATRAVADTMAALRKS